jgi:outer membrane receptor protein involved in Fe transport
VSLDGYFKYVTGITSLSQGFRNQYQYEKSNGSYKIKGLDVLLNRRFNNLNTWISYAYAVNTYTFDDFDPPSFPSNLDIRHTVTLGGSYTWKDLQISAGLNWHTGRPYTEPTGVENDEIVYDTVNDARLDDYLRIDLSVKYPFRISAGVNGELGVSIWNLLDRRNVVDIYFEEDIDGNAVAIQEYALGITPNLMFRVRF